jgi:hypothetical protein
MNDPILASFLDHQYREALELAGKSDLLDLAPLGPKPYQFYALRFSCKGLVRTGADIVESECSEVAIQFPDDYLRRAHPAQVLTWCKPANAFHPAIGYPFICPGHLYPAESFVELIYQCFDIITWRKVNMSEHNALNQEAAAWARANQNRFPIDPRPLVRRRWKITTADSPVQTAGRGKSRSDSNPDQEPWKGNEPNDHKLGSNRGAR